MPRPAVPQRSDDAAAQQGGSITEVDAVEVRLSVYHAFLHSSALFVYPIEYDVLPRGTKAPKRVGETVCPFRKTLGKG